MSSTLKNQQLKARRRRIRKVISGSPSHPRLSVNFSHTHVVAQLIDDTKAQTLIYVTTIGQKLPINLSQRAEWTGTEIAKAAAGAKITKVVFDRRGKPYHGRVKKLAEAARAGGLEF